MGCLVISCPVDTNALYLPLNGIQMLDFIKRADAHFPLYLPNKRDPAPLCRKSVQLRLHTPLPSGALSDTHDCAVVWDGISNHWQVGVISQAQSHLYSCQQVKSIYLISEHPLVRVTLQVSVEGS